MLWVEHRGPSGGLPVLWVEHRGPSGGLPVLWVEHRAQPGQAAARSRSTAFPWEARLKGFATGVVRLLGCRVAVRV